MTRRRVLPPALLTVALGGAIALQSRVNAALALHTGTGLFPAWWTMASGAVLLALGVGLHAPSRSGVGVALARIRSGSLPWWTVTGGAFGSFFLVAQSVTVPLVGVAVFAVAVVAGQTTGSLVVDRMGISASGTRAITWSRVVASIIAVVAVAIGVSDRWGTAAAALAATALALLAGFGVAPQQAANGRVAVASGSPFTAALVNFAGGFVLMTVVLGLWLVSSGLPDPWGAPVGAYAGGVLGLSVIVGAAWAVPILGVLVFALLSVLGQLGGALALDLLSPTEGTAVGWNLLVGVALTVVAVGVAGTGRGRGRVG